jgi:hypothetical protein
MYMDHQADPESIAVPTSSEVASVLESAACCLFFGSFASHVHVMLDIFVSGFFNLKSIYIIVVTAKNTPALLLQDRLIDVVFLDVLVCS